MLCDSGNSDQSSASASRGGRWREVKDEGGKVCLWLACAHVWQRPTQYCEAVFLQLKITKFGGKKKQNDTKGSFFWWTEVKFKCIHLGGGPYIKIKKKIFMMPWVINSALFLHFKYKVPYFSTKVLADLFLFFWRWAAGKLMWPQCDPNFLTPVS